MFVLGLLHFIDEFNHTVHVALFIISWISCAFCVQVGDSNIF